MPNARTFTVSKTDDRGRPLAPCEGARKTARSVRDGINTQLQGAPSDHRWKMPGEVLKPRPALIEAGGANAATIVEGWFSNALFGAVHVSFADHAPLVLSPDDIWLAIAQGFALHVNADPEALRHHFVSHAGKKQIDVVRNAFVKGAEDNDWPSVFGEFSDKIGEVIGTKKRDLVVSSFSTTSAVERIASEITLMDAMQNFFDYRVHTCCGIPEITLLGTVDDWKSVRNRTCALGEYGLDWWTNKLLPILDQFVDAANGKVDRNFWESIYKEGGGSGGPYVTGWVQLLFPYGENYEDGRLTRRNRFVEKWDWTKSSRNLGGMGGGPTSDALPPGIAKAPFIWHYYEQEFSMEFVSGFVGFTQDPTNFAVRPVIGWGVRDAAAPEQAPVIETVDRLFNCAKCNKPLSAKPPKDSGEVKVTCEGCGQVHYCSAREVTIDRLVRS